MSADEFIRRFAFLDEDTLRRVLSSRKGFRCTARRTEELLAARFLPLFEPPYLARFLRRVVRGERSADCWDWDGAKDRHGVPMLNVAFRDRRRPIGAHRLSYAVFRDGVIHEDALVLRLCHEPACANPTHLHLGDRRLAANGSMPRGEAHVGAKLTDEAVLKLRAERERGARYVELAARFGVSRATVRDAAVGRSWAHVA